MKILYGVCGEGFGHSSRAKTIIPYLQKKGHKVKVITYDKGIKVLKKQFDVFPIKGPTIKFKKENLDKSETIKKTLENFFSNSKKAKKIHNLMKQNFDLCISDMEPLVPILSNWYSLPLLSIDNQHRFSNLKIEVPKEYKKEFLMAKLVVNMFLRSADWYIITSFSKIKIKEKYKNKSFIVSPIIRPKVKKYKPSKKDFILVYFTKKDRNLIKVLKEINEKFKVYGWNKSKKLKNLEFKKSGDAFLNDLKNCKAIVASSGFTLISESLYLKKPYLAIPLKGQFEQVFNALYLQKAGLGDFSKKLDKESVQKFLLKIGEYEKKLKNYNPDYELLFKKLDKILKQVKKG